MRASPAPCQPGAGSTTTPSTSPPSARVSRRVGSRRTGASPSTWVARTAPPSRDARSSWRTGAISRRLSSRPTTASTGSSSLSGWDAISARVSRRERASLSVSAPPRPKGLGQVASQTRPEGASNARRTWVYVERCWRPRTKYGEANWPSTSADARAAIGPAREKSARLSGCLASRILLDHLLPGRARPRRVPHGALAQADLEQRLRDLRGLRVVVDRLLELHDRLLVVALPVEGLADPVLGGRGLRVIGELRDELRELEGGLAIFPRAELGEGRREHAIRVGIAERRRGWRDRRARGRRGRQHGRRRLRQGRGRRRGRRGHRSRALDGLHGETRVVDGGLELGELLAEALELGHEKSLLGIEGLDLAGQPPDFLRLRLLRFSHVLEGGGTRGPLHRGALRGSGCGRHALASARAAGDDEADHRADDRVKKETSHDWAP